jgi:hypothetical protein
MRTNFLSKRIVHLQLLSIATSMLMGAVLFGYAMAHAEPRPPQPPWPQPVLKVYGFDSDYLRAPWNRVSLFEERAELAESWSGYSLVREGFVTSPVVIPFEVEDERPSFAIGTGAVRFWVATSWSTASKTSGALGRGVGCGCWSW